MAYDKVCIISRNSHWGAKWIQTAWFRIVLEWVYSEHSSEVLWLWRAVQYEGLQITHFISTGELLLLYRMSENECTHFKHFYWETKQSQKSTVFTTRQRNCQSFTYDTCSVECTWLCACVSSMAFEYRMDIVRGTKGVQVEVQWNGEMWGENFLSNCFIWRKLYSPCSVYFLNKNV
jgi:hypothetical protein